MHQEGCEYRWRGEGCGQCVAETRESKSDISVALGFWSVGMRKKGVGKVP